MNLGDLVRPASEWERVLLASGVQKATLDRYQWGEVFADRMKPDTFSKGASELPDFLSTILHESMMLSKLKESGRYSASRIAELGRLSKPGSRWYSLVPRANELASTASVNNEDKFFEACYGGRMGNGPEGTGDGALFPGRSPIGLTGRANYALVGGLIGQDLDVTPQLAEHPHFGLDICIGWWEERVPDHCLGDERQVRYFVNGGYFGLAEVEAIYSNVLKALT